MLTQKRIVEKVEFYSQQLDPLKCAESLASSNEYRFRLGDYRVIFDVINHTLWVTAINARCAPTGATLS
jgi:mRNA-degrading endonuclease RelE of RelBE toxin-antitoxin system